MKHWQLFALVVVMPVILMISDGIMSLSPFVRGGKSITAIVGFAVCFAVFLGWFYALGIGLHSKLSSALRSNLHIFKSAVLIPLAYGAVVTVVMSYGFGSPGSQYQMTGLAIGLFFVFHLLSMACMIYVLFFVAKELKAVESGRIVSFSDYAGELFLLWFFPIGIWFLQPRINTMFAE
jgi:hypothetical protein